MTAHRKGRRQLRPLGAKDLDELALKYVGRYATTRAKLRSYLARKVRERGWDGEGEPDLVAVADRMAEAGYIDDAAYALSKSQALAGRGYGKRRLSQKLREAGVAEDDSRRAFDHADQEAVDSALRFARRRRIGPFGTAQVRDPRERERALTAMVRAGHPFGLARAVVNLAPGDEIDAEDLAERSRLNLI